ncbi:hypothetical protein TKK_0004825 [Trichogramma kaykai]|uniref:Protein brambleberry n=1 Tax=Trichogramma kaykai TaxID=54128 RepID=A0ABD2XKE3_9HYME
MNVHCCLLVALATLSSVQSQSVLNWFWGSGESQAVVSDGVPLISIPYESLTEDEKFLKEASKFVTDIQVSSPLEVCQHKVIMKIKTSCSSMSEEQLAKLSVNLLNCQSENEGRRTFPCTDGMTIKECTSDMDADTWNAYHLMSNRARAVCYASRSNQFRALTEITVNRLMQSAHNQIKTLDSLKESQDRLEEQTANAHKIIETNIEDLTKEKALIRIGHDQLAAMTEDIKNRLEKASQNLENQAAEQSQNHEELISDLENIQIQARELWNKIENSTNRIIAQNNAAAAQYEQTMLKLERMNETIVFLSDLTDKMRAEVDEKLGWIKQYIGSTGEHLEKIYRITLHVIYLLGAMVVAAFLHAPFLTRTAIMGIIPLNLASYLKHGLTACLDFYSLTVLIILITTMHYIMNAIQYLVRSKSSSELTKEDIKKIYKTLRPDEMCSNQKMSTKDFPDGNEKENIFKRVGHNIHSLIYSINRQINYNIVNMKIKFKSLRRWIWVKFTPTEELSCSYLPAKTYQECIIRSTNANISISDDGSDFEEYHGTDRFVDDDYSVSGAVLKHRDLDKFTSPLTTYTSNIRNPEVVTSRTTSRAKPKIISDSILTPATRPLCGARTRSGNPCRLLSSKGQNFCHRHATGGSVIGD